MLLLNLLVDFVPVHLDLLHVLDLLGVVLLLVTPGQVLEPVGQHRDLVGLVLVGQLQRLLPLVKQDVLDVVDLVRLLDGGLGNL